MNEDNYCETHGKVKYNSPQEAYKHASVVKNRKLKKELRVYMCPFCHKYHLSHSTRKYRK